MAVRGNFMRLHAPIFSGSGRRARWQSTKRKRDDQDGIARRGSAAEDVISKASPRLMLMTVFIALLRAVNVGGTGKLPMKELKAACEEAGLTEVSTYVVSGNIVFASDKSAAAVKTSITDLLRKRFGLAKNHTLIRTPKDLAKAIARNPFADAAAKRPNRLVISFLDGLPQAGAAAALAAFDGPERVHLDGEHLYIDYAEGIGRSKLTPAFLDRALQVPATGRNWNTANKLLEMARALEVQT
jgi:uncharacterized protein (DUF1697 family)